jgi:hypothetical protein
VLEMSWLDPEGLKRFKKLEELAALDDEVKLEINRFDKKVNETSFYIWLEAEC